MKHPKAASNVENCHESGSLGQYKAEWEKVAPRR